MTSDTSGLKREIESFKQFTNKLSDKTNSVGDIWQDANFASLVIRRMSGVVSHMSGVICHMSGVIRRMAGVVRRMSGVISHMSGVIGHMSGVIRHRNIIKNKYI